MCAAVDAVRVFVVCFGEFILQSPFFATIIYIFLSNCLL